MRNPSQSYGVSPVYSSSSNSSSSSSIVVLVQCSDTKTVISYLHKNYAQKVTIDNSFLQCNRWWV